MTTVTKTGQKKSDRERRLAKEMAALEAAATAKDELAFLAARKAIDWTQRPAEDFIRAVDLALMAGAHLAARHLAMEGAERFPDHAELQKMAHVLAPPTVTVVKDAPNTTWKGDREWLKANWEAYRGQWVALLNGQLLGAAQTLEALIEQVGDVKGKGILVTPIW